MPTRYVAQFLIVSLIAVLAASFLSAQSARIQVHGHRGARARMPENTVPAFLYAIEQGVDVIELDMAVTKDDVIVVSHDPVLRAPVCTGPRDGAAIRELTLKEVRQWDCGAQQNPRYPDQKPVPHTAMPTLDDVFRLASRGKFLFNIETKITAKQPEYTPSPEVFAKLVLDKIREHKLEKRVIVQSFDFRTLVAMRKLAPEIRLSALIESGDRDYAAIAATAGNAEVISPEYHLVTPAKVEAAHKAGLEVVPWTANTEADWEKLVAAKVDAIISDDPASLIAFLKKKGLR